MTTPPVALAFDKANLRARFQRLAAEWKERSRYFSNTAQMAMLPSYQRIIGMGWDAVPLILEELQREPDQWFWALEAITEENPVPREAAGKVRLMPCGMDLGAEPGFVKVALHGSGLFYTRAARQLANGKWTSKPGKGEDIEHDHPEDVAGGLYGQVRMVVKRPTGRAP
jgi:hypothetical protein